MASESFHQQEEKSSVVDALLRLNNGSSRNNINVNGEEQPFINPWEAAADEHFQSYDDDGDDGVPQRQQPPAVWPGSVESYWREGDVSVFCTMKEIEERKVCYVACCYMAWKQQQITLNTLVFLGHVSRHRARPWWLLRCNRMMNRIRCR